MAEYIDVIARAQDGAITVIAQAEDVAVSALSSWTGRIADMLPALPELPFAGSVPAPREFVELNFSFLQRLVETQRDYALKVLKALGPITDQVLLAPKKVTKVTKASPKSA